MGILIWVSGVLGYLAVAIGVAYLLRRYLGENLDNRDVFMCGIWPFYVPLFCIVYSVYRFGLLVKRIVNK